MPIIRPPRPPSQARSQASLERLLTAVEQVIGERGVPRLTVQEVARRAGLATGTLYTRFTNKDALLRAVTATFFDRARRTADALLDDARWRGMAPRPLVAAIVRTLVKSYRAKRPLLRALYLYMRTHPDTDFQAEAAAFNSDFVRRLTSLLLRHRQAITHPTPDRAVLLGLLVVDAAAKETILFGDGRPADLVVSDDELADTLTRLYCDLLGLRESGP
jgi:AcrR family transcriptional regulator